MTRTHWARGVSVLGHPALVMPLSVCGRALVSPQGAPLALAAGSAAALVAAVTLGYGWRRVRAGRWAHADASRTSERLELNAVLAGLLFGTALLAAVAGAPRAVVAGAAACGAVVLLALVARRLCQLSLHVAFATLAAALWWPHAGVVAAGAALAAAVAWSRLVLGRHVLRDVVAGAVAGALAGIALLAWS